MNSIFRLVFILYLSVKKKSAKILVGKNQKSAKKSVTFLPTKFLSLVTFYRLNFRVWSGFVFPLAF